MKLGLTPGGGFDENIDLLADKCRKPGSATA